MPEADDATRMLLVAHAMRSQGYVAALESGAARARFFATQAGRTLDFADVERVMIESGTNHPVRNVVRSFPDLPPPKPRGTAAKVSQKAGVPTLSSDRQPLGALAATTDFTGTRPPGLLP